MTLDTSFVCHYSSGPSIAPACATAGNTGTIAPPGAISPAAASGGSRRGGRHSDVRVALGCTCLVQTLREEARQRPCVVAFVVATPPCLCIKHTPSGWFWRLNYRQRREWKR